MQDGSNKTVGIIIGIVALLLIGGGAFWALSMNNDDTGEEQSSTQLTESESGEAAEQANIVGLASQTESLSTLVTAVQAADLVETLQGEGPFTVFAPTNQAFEALPEGTLASLLEPANIDQLKSILTYHVVSGAVMSSQLSDGQEITTVQGGKLTVKIMDNMVYIVDAAGNEAQVQTADVDASNGVVHIINGVLLPQ